jgi:CHAD domain
VKARKVKKLDATAPLGENAARIVRTRVAELRSFVPEALSPGAAEAQHDMRIAAKRLRYVLELTGLCFGRPADRARRRAGDLQDLLGEMHDCDVMLPRVQMQIERLHADDARAVLLRAADAEDLDPSLVARAPNRAAYRGLELLLVHLRARRALLFERFRDFWQTEVSKGTWTKLERGVDEHLDEAITDRGSVPGQQPELAPRETARVPSNSAS